MIDRRIARYAKLVDHDDVYAWLACGWMPHRDFEGRYPCNDGREGAHGVLLVWVCDCEMKRPSPDERHLTAEEQEVFWETLRRSTRLLRRASADETQRDHDEEALYGWSINRRSAL